MTNISQQRKKAILAARSCVGSPFRHQGRIPASGLDCVGLIIYVASVLNLEIVGRSNYRKIPKRHAITRAAREFGFREKPVSESFPGDILLLKFGKSLEHVAVLSDHGIIHACEKYGKVVEHKLDQTWMGRITKAYEFPETQKSEG